MKTKQSNYVVQTSMDTETKEKLDYLTNKGGFDSNAAFLRSVIRVQYADQEESRMLNQETIKNIEEGIRDFENGIFVTEEEIHSLIEEKLNEKKAN